MEQSLKDRVASQERLKERQSAPRNRLRELRAIFERDGAFQSQLLQELRQLSSMRPWSAWQTRAPRSCSRSFSRKLRIRRKYVLASKSCAKFLRNGHGKASGVVCPPARASGRAGGPVSRKSVRAVRMGSIGRRGNPYLTLFSRAGTSREGADRAADQLLISELPSARSCTYVLPRSEFALALTVARALQNATEWTTARKLGVTEDEINLLEAKVLEALEGGAKDPAAIKKEVGDASRNLGEEGKKKGLRRRFLLRWPSCR